MPPQTAQSSAQRPREQGKRNTGAIAKQAVWTKETTLATSLWQQFTRSLSRSEKRIKWPRRTGKGLPNEVHAWASLGSDTVDSQSAHAEAYSEQTLDLGRPFHPCLTRSSTEWPPPSERALSEGMWGPWQRLRLLCSLSAWHAASLVLLKKQVSCHHLGLYQKPEKGFLVLERV